MLAERKDWRKIKEKHGIPDKVCSFSMGERYDVWGKKYTTAETAKDHKGRLDAVEGLIKDLQTYANALKGAKPAKFKGKTTSEQTTSHKNAQSDVAGQITYFGQIQKGTHSLVFPMITLKKNLAVSRNKLSSISKTDLGALKVFYETEYRNETGKFVAKVLAQNPVGKLKTALDNYVATGDLIDNWVDDCTDTDAPKMAKIYAAFKIGMDGLALEVG